MMLYFVVHPKTHGLNARVCVRGRVFFFSASVISELLEDTVRPSHVTLTEWGLNLFDCTTRKVSRKLTGTA